MANRNIERAVRVALLAAGAASMGAIAPYAAAQDQEIEQIVVTGSRIPQPNLEGTSPVTLIGAQDVALQGVTKVEDLINSLPQAFADQGGNLANGATGTATVNLRNLGATRTLVLVNGRRLPAGDPNGGQDGVAPDLNTIPAPLIERVEVLTGGASAVYGSDAVAGVVNFIMKDNFEGVQFDANYNFYNHQNDLSALRKVQDNYSYVKKAPSYVNDGSGYEFGLTMGANFADDRGNATVYVGYRESDALWQSERDVSACALGYGATDFTCGGSGTSYPGNVLLSGVGYFQVTPDGGVAPGRSTFNYAPYNFFQRPDERWTFDTFAHFDLSDSATVYMELNFMDDVTDAQIAPSGIFLGSYEYPVPCSGENPLISEDWLNYLCVDQGLGADEFQPVLPGRRNVDGAPRSDYLHHTMYRGVVGLKGEVFDRNWNYDVYAQYGVTNYEEIYQNDFGVTKIARALDVVSDPDTGAPVCRSVLDGTDPNCIPYDFWNFNVTPQAIDYLTLPLFSNGFTKQTVVHAELASNLGDYGVTVPSASSGIGIAFGVEYREEDLELRTDENYQNFEGAGQGGPSFPISGAFNVMDYFAELRIPLLDDVFLADTLSINGSYRYSDYSTGTTTDTYGIGLDWGPIQALKFRGSYQRAVRAPNVIELFRNQGLGLYDMDEDPCAGPNPTYSLEACRRTFETTNPALADQLYGVIPDSPAGQYNYLTGGNTELDPEESDSYTVGIVLTPTGLFDGFTMSVDYFNIKVDGLIGSVNPETTLFACLDEGVLCDQVFRDTSGYGSLWLADAQIIGTYVNLAKLETSGVDLNLGYTHGVGGLGSMNWTMTGTYLDKYEQTEIPGLTDAEDLAGTWSTGSIPLPEWRHRLRATWMTPWNLDLSLAWRYMDGIDATSSAVPDYAAKLDSMNYIDLAASWTVLEHYTLRFGVNNVTDEDPPYANTGAGYGNGNTYPQVYDALGRYVFFNFSAKY